MVQGIDFLKLRSIAESVMKTFIVLFVDKNLCMVAEDCHIVFRAFFPIFKGNEIKSKV